MLFLQTGTGSSGMVWRSPRSPRRPTAPAGSMLRVGVVVGVLHRRIAPAGSADAPSTDQASDPSYPPDGARPPHRGAGRGGALPCAAPGLRRPRGHSCPARPAAGGPTADRPARAGGPAAHGAAAASPERGRSPAAAIRPGPPSRPTAAPLTDRRASRAGPRRVPPSTADQGSPERGRHDQSDGGSRGGAGAAVAGGACLKGVRPPVRRGAGPGPARFVLVAPDDAA
jgi:hypothetical protein